MKQKRPDLHLTKEEGRVSQTLCVVSPLPKWCPHYPCCLPILKEEKLSKESQHGPAILCLGIYPKDPGTNVWQHCSQWLKGGTPQMQFIHKVNE